MTKLTVLRPRTILAFGFVAFGLLVACSRQGEGERCSKRNDNNDCEAGLECVEAGGLRSQDGVDRCCPREGRPVSDGRCTRLIGGDNGDGEGGEGGEGPTNSASSTTAGKTCNYNSDCAEGLVCGPDAKCQAECRQDRDCPPEHTCTSAGRCVPQGG